MKTTLLERKILANIAENLLAPLNGAEPESVNDAECWTNCVGSEGPFPMGGKTLSGGMSSLTKKGLITSDSDGGTYLTEAGFIEYKTTRQLI